MRRLFYVLLFGIVVMLILTSMVYLAPKGSYLYRIIFDDPDDFIIMCFTVVLGLAAFYQGILMNDQDKKLTETLNETKRSTDEGKRSAERQLRAYLSVESGNTKKETNLQLHIENIYDENQPLDSANPADYHICLLSGFDILVNRGKTPAVDILYEIKPIWFESYNGAYLIEEIRKFQFNHDKSIMRNLGFLNPSASHQFPYYGKTSPLDVRVFSKSQYKLLVMYKFLYSDAFDARRLLVKCIVFDEPFGSCIYSVYNEGTMIDQFPDTDK